MPGHLNTVADLIAEWPSAEQFSRDLNLKHTSHGRAMRQRGSINERWWDAIVLAASKRGIDGVTHRVLAQINENEARRRSALERRSAASAQTGANAA